MTLNLIEIVSTFMILFAVIDITGSIPIIIDLKKKSGQIESLKATLVALAIMIAFLILGEKLLGLFGVDISSFAIGGSIVLFLMGLEMVMGIELFKYDNPGGASIVPIAFPLIAGAGSITSLLSLKAEYETINILIALLLNMIVVYIVLRATKVIERFLGDTGIHILRKMFGVILLAISVKLFLSNTGINIPTGA